MRTRKNQDLWEVTEGYGYCGCGQRSFLSLSLALYLTSQADFRHWKSFLIIPRCGVSTLAHPLSRNHCSPSIPQQLLFFGSLQCLHSLGYLSHCGCCSDQNNINQSRNIISENHRIIEFKGLEETLKDNRVQPPNFLQVPMQDLCVMLVPVKCFV